MATIEPCRMCMGMKKHPLTGEDCERCAGSGEELDSAESRLAAAAAAPPAPPQIAGSKYDPIN